MKSYQIRVAPYPVTGIFIRERRGRLNIETQRNKAPRAEKRTPLEDRGRDWSDNCKPKIVKDCWPPSEARKRKEEFFPKAFRESLARTNT